MVLADDISKKEKRLLAIACSGYLTLYSASALYCTFEYAEARVRNLVSRGYLEFNPVNYGYFRITEKGMDALVGA